MKTQSRIKRNWRLITTFLLMVLIGVGLWYFQSSSNQWSWEDQVKMEIAMASAADAAPGAIPEIDRSIPQTETALFALG